MKRLHVHVAVADLEESIAFYRTLFGSEPGLREADYARWMLDDPRVNFAISTRGRSPGLDHLGVQVESDSELREVAGRLSRAGRPILEQKEAACCYAKGDKLWSSDPQGLRWETFLTRGGLSVYGEDAPTAPSTCTSSTSACGAGSAPTRSPSGSCC